MSLKSTWPPPTHQYWQIETHLGLQLVYVVLHGHERPLIKIPSDSKVNWKRIFPILQVASVASWRLGACSPRQHLTIQLHDEDPGRHSLRYDAAINDTSVLLPDPYALGSQGYLKIRKTLSQQPLPVWNERKSQAFWRGSSTSSKAITIHRMHKNRRINLCRLSRKMPKLLNCCLTDVVQCRDQNAKLEVSKSLKAEGLLSDRCAPMQFGLHKYLIEIDGNVNSWGLLWKLLTGSCILRVNSARRQWYHHKLKPYLHIIPVKEDLSDLHEKLSWCHDHEEECEEIGRQGKILAEQVIEDLGPSVLKAIDAQFMQVNVNGITIL